jgi:hypothetical protein
MKVIVSPQETWLLSAVAEMKQVACTGLMNRIAIIPIARIACIVSRIKFMGHTE